MTGQRPGRAGERCTCGRAAVLVFTGGPFDETGYCGIPDGGANTEPCPFCGHPRSTHPLGRCPHYQLSPEAGQPSGGDAA